MVFNKMNTEQLDKLTEEEKERIKKEIEDIKKELEFWKEIRKELNQILG